MLIESKIRRLAGTRVDFGTATYHFRPDALGRHVANVDDEDHLSRLLSITEGFRVAAPVAAEAPVQPAPAALEPAPAPSAPVTASEPVNATVSTIPVIDVIEDEGEEQESTETDEGEDGSEETGAPTERLDDETAKQARRDELAAEYKGLFGRKPAYNKSIESLERDIAERRAANAKAAG